jgi:hypothetical protein
MLMIAFGLASVTAPAIDQRFADQAKAACAAPVGQRPRLAGIRIERLAADPGDLPKLRIIDQRNGSWMLAYYDPAGEQAAYARAACLGASQRSVALRGCGNEGACHTLTNQEALPCVGVS